MKYLLLGDMIASRTYTEKEVYSKINKVAKKINKEFKLSVPLVITLGDEFQLVCKDMDQVKDVIDRIDSLFGKMDCRYVVCYYKHDTSKYNTIKKIDKIMEQTYRNPLICEEFKASHDILEKAYNGIVIIDK